MINLNKILIFLFLFPVFSFVLSIPELCTVAQRWSINGRAFVEEYRGKVLFLVFMRLDCAACESTIRRCDSYMKYEAIAEHFNNEISIVIVAPHSESDSRIRNLQTQYPTVRIAKESHQEPLWGWLKVGHNDGLIFDRCGRLAKSFRLPNEGIETSSVVFDSLRSVVTGQPCGPCNYDRTNPRIQDQSRQLPQNSVSMNDVSRIHQQQQKQTPQDSSYMNSASRIQQQQQKQTSQDSSYMNSASRIQQQQKQTPQAGLYMNSASRIQQQQQKSTPQDSSYMNSASRIQQQQQKSTPQMSAPMISAYVAPSNKQKQNFYRQPQQQADRPQLNSIPKHGNSQNDKNHKPVEEFESVTVDYRRESSEGKIFAQQQQPGVFNNDWVEVDSKSSFGKITEESSKKPKPSDSPDPLYPESDDFASESDYYDYVADLTTPNPEHVQIPKPSSPSPLWPTKAPIFTTGSGQSCAGYNDEICYQQFAQLDDSEIHPCCRRKIVLTDQCVPGKCSNVTQQLCCIQKFLQAKLTCCLDEKQLISTSDTDSFSRCCYSNFVTFDDNCCSHAYASAQWKFVHELCLPNVKVDLSDVKVKTYVPGTSVTTDFDFRYVKRWNFECKYGSQVAQYSYIENW